MALERAPLRHKIVALEEGESNQASVVSVYVYDRLRSVEKQSIVVVASPLVEDQVADVIDDVLKLHNHARHPTQLGIWQCARPIFPV